MSFSKLSPGQTFLEHLIMELSGIDNWVAVAFRGGVVSANIAWCYEYDDRQISGSNRHCVGVPRILLLANQLSHITCYDEDVMIDFF